MKIGIVTDSTCDLNQSIIDKYNIEIVPLSVHFGNRVYTDGIDLNANEFFRKLKGAEEIPGTSCPSPGLFAETYKRMAEKYDTILSIHVSSGLSGTLDTARLGAKKVPEVNFYFFDSATISLGLGFLVLLAAKMVKKGETPKDIIDTLKKAKKNLLLYFTVDELTYMEKGGRIGKASAFLGSIFNINPIISISTSTGKVLPLHKIRGKARTTRKMIEIAIEKIANEKKAWLGFAHGDREKDLEKFKKSLLSRINSLDSLETLSSRISPTLGCHVGPSVYALAIITGDFLL